MSWQRIIPLVTKDFMLFLRDKLFGFLTFFCIALFIAIYFIMPKTVNETVKIGFYAAKDFNMFNKTTAEKGVVIRSVSTEDELKQAVMDKQYHIGISIAGKSPQIFVYYSSDIPDEMKEMFTILIGEMINGMSGYKIKLDHIFLGTDMGGKQIPFRDRLLPILVFFLLITAVFILANLITSELESKTIQALLTTPMKVIDLFVGKSFVGVFLAFSHGMIFMIAAGSLSRNTFLIVILLLLGSMMVTGLAFFIASISKDIMTVVAWGSLFVMILSIPAVTVIFPGTVSGWIKVIPSFYIVDTLHRAVNFGIGWSGNIKNILFITGFNIVFVFLGIITLKRKVKCALEE